VNYRGAPTEARFLAKVQKAESGCWNWASTLDRRKLYGKFWYAGEQVRAHRMSYQLFVGPIPDGAMVLHKCDNAKCVNPEHLYIGDQSRNCRDRTERLRYMVRLPLESVRAIRERYAAGGVSQELLAAEFGIHQTQVSKYVTGKQRVLR
jgi:hypothetical protein